RQLQSRFPQQIAGHDLDDPTISPSATAHIQALARSALQQALVHQQFTGPADRHPAEAFSPRQAMLGPDQFTRLIGTRKNQPANAVRQILINSPASMYTGIYRHA